VGCKWYVLFTHILFGYIFNDLVMILDAYQLRERYGIVGAMVGGIATFKQQNAVRGLPLQLSPEEVTYLLRELHAIRLYSMKESADRMREPLEDTGVRSGGDSSSSESLSDSDSSGEDGEEWQHALAHGTEFVIPTEAPEMEERTWDISWSYPQTEEETCRYLIFVDLKNKKYTITAGSKFGADYLLYPGDPTQFHAQFCVRIKNIDDRVVPASLAAACRGSFQARKHLLYASIDTDQRVLYTTFGQIGGFG
jgi:tRNA splicing endonuclease